MEGTSGTRGAADRPRCRRRGGGRKAAVVRGCQRRVGGGDSRAGGGGTTKGGPHNRIPVPPPDLTPADPHTDADDLPLASGGSDMIRWSRVLLSHTLDAARSY